MLEYDEAIEKLDTKISQLKAQKRELETKQKQKEKRERTKRLIQNGALAEKYLNCEGMNPDEFEKILKTVVSLVGDVL